jgi:murein DD-endopeptidase MepM/ murein hydrolase activator NlpD
MYKRQFVTFITLILITGCRTNVDQAKLDFSPNKQILNIKKTRVLIPKNYRQEATENKELVNNYFSLELYARRFVHGDIIYAELIPYNKVKFGDDLKISVNGVAMRLKQNDWGYRGFFAIHPENENRKVTFEINFHVDGKRVTERHAFELEEKQFPISTSAMNIGKFSRTDLPVNLKLQERIQKEYNLKVNIFKIDSPDQLTGILSHPRNYHYLTSPFYEKRIYEQYEMKGGKKIDHKPKVSYHSGLDFFARWGDPVFSMASGKVVLAQSMYFEGNCVMIDHGGRILSVYMHMSKLKVEEGQIIKPGDLIGYAGATGIATGSHLHVSLYVNGVPADPLSLLYLPIRD